jgi:hypothetical protein
MPLAITAEVPLQSLVAKLPGYVRKINVDIGQTVRHHFGGLVKTVTVGTLHHEVVGPGHGFGVADDGKIRPAHVSGKVVLQATISKTGSIENLHVLSGPPMLQQAAMYCR